MSENRSSSFGTTFLSNFTLFETDSHFLLCGTDSFREKYKVLHIDLINQNASVPNVMEYPDTFSSASLRQFLAGKAANNPLRVKTRAVAFLGFVCLCDDDWHLHFATEASPVGVIGGRTIYRVDNGVLIAIKPNPESGLPQHVQKNRSLFSSVDITKDFYFSYSYDLSRSLQSNVIDDHQYVKSFFTWNWAAIQNSLQQKCQNYWLTPLIYGFFEQQTLELSLEKGVVVTLLCRRSRMMAGTRYQRRGLSSSGRGDVANEVLTELYITVGDQWLDNSEYAAVAVHRGSIPLFWGHDQEKISQPKPEFYLTKNDQNFGAAEIHLKRMLDEYKSPVICLSLIRQGSHKECVLGNRFDLGMHIFSTHHRFKPDDLEYVKYDFLGAQKAGGNIIEDLRSIVKQKVERIGFLVHNSVQTQTRTSPKRIQSGIFRINCVDCLDRTNVAQFCVIRECLSEMLEALDLNPGLDWEAMFPNLSCCIKDLFMRHGDRIAHQYAGSGAMHKHAFESSHDDPNDNTIKGNGIPERSVSQNSMDQVKGRMLSTFGKLKTNASNNNAITAIRRFYSNAVTDITKNQAIQVFIGHARADMNTLQIWEIPADSLADRELHWDPADDIKLKHPWKINRTPSAAQEKAIVIENGMQEVNLFDASFFT
uniref:SAC domain-containing protein n=1 Tax=Spongospora subterranea TaxID=70186 RepID=A0A0H5RCC1_9EUKA|eukprot:CRZ11247.1 hypothetical protein [Spongospora subterranea]